MMQGGIKTLISLDLPRAPGGARDALARAGSRGCGASSSGAADPASRREAASPLTPAETNPLPARTHTRGLLSFRRTKRNRSGCHGKKMDLD